ncbi:hypothetical protein RND81_01G170700 [Saponaria officinalis]|uniref:Uncharacterized protein n=1 Tax=Saponaria officinalis TaxID=3572 RepID=A0AAW1NHU6_SAPOF
MTSTENGINDIVRDRVSEMPDEVIVRILSRMPTLDAVRTMLLRRFGELWTLASTLWFDFDDYHDAMIDPPSSYLRVLSYFSRFVRNVLMLHRGSNIDTFEVYIYERGDYFNDVKMIDDVQMWLRFAVNRGVRDLCFCFNGQNVFAPPPCVFTCQSIDTLVLNGCMIVEYEDEQPLHMGSLRKLALTSVQGCNDAFNQLISGCPSLQELIVKDPLGLQLLNITNPSISKLNLDLLDRYGDPLTLHCPNVKILDIAISNQCEPFQLWVTDVSSLQVVNLKDLPNNCPYGLVKAIVKHFRNVERFSLSRKAFKQFSSMNKVDFPHNSWKRLVLRPWWNHETCVQVILKLVKSSVKLEELIIYSGQSSDM